ncbi:MAG: three-Cys-motif partner protein TcmP [Thermodesulfobacteriota bacterium]|nr:three-Cys-motif partner protein TcmP [Thermodesulfobacteriota bacterium]
MAKDLNKKPYDEATLTKLEIFEQYLIAWLPVFIHTPHTSKAMICDFCAGSGYDSIGIDGSPIRIVKRIDNYRDQIFQNDIHIDILLNDVKIKKYRELENAVAESFQEESWHGKVTLSCHNEDFQQLFRQQYERLKQQPNLLFIDQSGVRQVTNEIFQMLIGLNKTDFLFFISSSAIKRFAGTAEFSTLVVIFLFFLAGNQKGEIFLNSYTLLLRYLSRTFKNSSLSGLGVFFLTLIPIRFRLPSMKIFIESCWTTTR